MTAADLLQALLETTLTTTAAVLAPGFSRSSGWSLAAPARTRSRITAVICSL